MISGAVIKRRYTVLWVLVICSFISCICRAQGDDYWSRNRRYEVFVEVQDLSGDTAAGNLYIGSTSYNINTNMGGAAIFGVGVGVNFTRRINLNVELLHGSTDFTYTISSNTSHTDIDYWFFNTNLEYYLFRGPVTPVIGYGFGVAKFEATQPFEESEFSSNYIVGIRWDVRKRIAYKLLYQSMKTDFGSDSIRLGGLKATACFMFK